MFSWATVWMTATMRTPYSRKSRRSKIGHFSYVVSQRLCHRDGFFARCFDEHDIARLALHQGRDLRVGRATQQIALPVSRNGAVFDLRGSLANGDRSNDLTLTRSGAALLGPAHAGGAAQMLNQLLFQVPRACKNRLR